jgi:hypothetical protein
VTRLHGTLPDKLIARFCETIAFAKEERAPEKHEQVALNNALLDIARAALRSGMTPERVVIELKAAWTRVCHREPSPDMNDPHWDMVLRMMLDAYERARISAA